MFAALCSLVHRVALFGEEVRALQVADEAPDEVRPSLFARKSFLYRMATAAGAVELRRSSMERNDFLGFAPY